MPSKKVFIWNEYPKWRRVARRILKEHLDDKVISRLREIPPEYVVSDDLSWLDDAVAEVKGFRPDTKAQLASGLKQHYQYLRAYHGCRPVSLDSYRQLGVRPCNPSELQAIARQIFKNKEGVEEAILHLASSSRFLSYEEHNSGKVFFCLTRRELVEFCGHYLLHGSEYLQAIACRINESHVLRERGKATVIECDIPIGDMDTRTISELAGVMLERIGYGLLRWPPETISSNFGLSITVPLAAKNIVAVEHPTGIPNPHNYNIRED
ncbi:MAG: hypothetical protein LV479_03610 [Methylacidiphilales bacterium]|nr:hypothetical protein [Candidatus Methylacidiphilales bacterium]